MTELTEAVVGVIGRAHGVRGAVLVEPRTDEIAKRFAAGSVLRGEDGRHRFTVETAKDHSGRLVVQFAELMTREAAETVRGTVLLADVATDEVPDDPEEFYDRHLIGLRVLRHDGTEVGEVIAVQHPGAQDLLVVATDGGERLVPFTLALVPTVDLEAGTCTLADVAGLVDDDAEEAR